MNNVTVFTGPMRCGKTTRLIEEFNKHKYSNKRVLMFKPSIDDRFNKEKVVSRDDMSIESYNINALSDLLLFQDKADIFFIDEFQFLNGDINDLLYLIDLGKQFYISGLNMTAERKPFGLMGNLLCIADNIIICKAICENCYEYDAIFTFCKVSKNNDILVGDDVYMPVCSHCYNKLRNQET